MDKAYISWMTLFEDVLFKGSVGKLSTIWFNKLVLQVPKPEQGPRMVEIIKGIEKISSDTENELNEILVPIQNEIPGYKFLGSNPWESSDQELVKIAEKVTIEDEVRMNPEVSQDNSFFHEVAWAGAGLIESIVLWGILNSKSPVGIISHRRESSVIQELYSHALKSKPEALFTSYLKTQIPSFEEISWDRTIELRRHPFAENFRRKIKELHSLSQNGDMSRAKELVEEAEKKDLSDLVRIATSYSESVGWLNCVLSNVPLPILVNPYSIASGLAEMEKNRLLKERFGWLNFSFELRRSA